MSLACFMKDSFLFTDDSIYTLTQYTCKPHITSYQVNSSEVNIIYNNKFEASEDCGVTVTLAQLIHSILAKLTQISAPCVPGLG